MKYILELLKFIFLFIGLPIVSGMLVDLAVQIITMEMIVNLSYVLLAVGSIYIMKDIIQD